MSNLGNKQIMANNIRYYMNIHSVSQTEICNTLGFKMPTFSDWVNAKTCGCWWKYLLFWRNKS